MTGELSPASVYVSLLPVVEACVVVAVPGRVGEVRVAADEPEAVDLEVVYYSQISLGKCLIIPHKFPIIVVGSSPEVLNGIANDYICQR